MTKDKHCGPKRLILLPDLVQRDFEKFGIGLLDYGDLLQLAHKF
jgi:hypothetical protein